MSTKDGQAGFAIVFAVGILAVLSALMALLFLEARSYRRSVAAAVMTFRAQQEADGAIFRTAFALANVIDTFHPPLDGSPNELEIGSAHVTVRVTSESGKIDLNRDSLETLTALFRAIGAETEAAANLAHRALNWRQHGTDTQTQEISTYADAGRDYAPRFGPLTSASEINLVLGMSPALAAALPDVATVWSNNGFVDRASAPRAVLEALAGGDDSAARSELNARAVEGAKRVPRRVAPGEAVTIEATVPNEVGVLTRRALVILRWDQTRPFDLIWLR